MPPKRLIGELTIAAALLAGAVTAFYWPQRDLVARGLNDFPAFYTAGALAGTHDLYHKQAFLARQNAEAGAFNQSIQFVRLPYYALVFLPLARLPFRYAYWLWQAGCLGALVGFCLLWPGCRKFLPAICMVPPVVASFANGQDVPFLLLWIALSVSLIRGERPYLAGLAMALCLAKPHLFVYVPLALAAQRQWKVMAGAAAGAGALLLLSFGAGGIAWPAELLHVWRDPSVHPSLGAFSPLASLLRAFDGPAAQSLLLFFVYGAAAAAVWVVSRRVSTGASIAAAMAAGPLTAYHVYLQDSMLLLPLIVVALANEGTRLRVPPDAAIPPGQRFDVRRFA